MSNAFSRSKAHPSYGPGLGVFRVLQIEQSVAQFYRTFHGLRFLLSYSGFQAGAQSPEGSWTILEGLAVDILCTQLYYICLIRVLSRVVGL